jgi:hypothetical protein
VEIVFGVSMTPTTVSIALVEGEKADGVIVERDVFEISTDDGSATSNASDHVIAAILGTQEGAIAAGHRLVSTGVTWTDHAQAAVLREALVARGVDDVLLVSELHAAAALAQAVGRAVGYDTTALMFVERGTATLAVVETADGSVVKVLRQSLHGVDTIAVLTAMVNSLQAEESMPQGMFVVGSEVDVTAVKAHLQDLVAVPVIAPEEPELALARGAALASANAPRFDAFTVGLAYSQVHDGTTDYPLVMADDATIFVDANPFLDTDDIASETDDATERSKPFLLMGSSLTAIFVAGMAALAIAMAISIQPTADEAPDAMPVPPGAAAPPGPVPPAPQQQVPDPAAVAPRLAAANATAHLKALPPSPPPQVVVQNAAPAPAAPPPAPGPPPPVAAPPWPPPPLIQWFPPILRPPPFFNPGPRGPWGRGGGGGGHGGGGHGGGGHGGGHGHGGD